MPVSFLSLPSEIQSLVFALAHFRVIVRCRCVCKQLLKLIDSSPALKLIIELGASARRDNPAYPGTSIQKLQELQEINVAWANLHWKHRIQIPFPENVTFVKFSGGRVFYVFDEDPYDSEEEAREGPSTVILWAELPSRRNPQPNATNLLVLEYIMDDMAIDAARDLFIGVKLQYFKANGGHTFECQLYPTSIATGEKHPDASKSVISSRFFVQLKTAFATSAHICGNHVGILLTRDSGHYCRRGTFDVFYLWDWTTGICKVHMNSFEVEERWESFCFITPDSILMSSTFKGHLNLFRFDENPDSLSHLYTFSLPESRYKPSLRHISLCSEPTPSFRGECANLQGCVEAPFPVEPDDAIVIVRLDYFYPPPGHENAPDVDGGCTLVQNFAIPRRFFAQALHFPFSEISAPPDCESVGKRFINDRRAKRHPHCHSENWIHFCRWDIESSPPESMQSYVCGSRFLGMTSRLEHPELRFSDITLYDFNLRNERRGAMMFEPNTRHSIDSAEECNGTGREDAVESLTKNLRWPVRPSRIVTKKKIMQHTMLTRSFQTTLPYRVTESEIALDWDTAALDEERIIGIVMEDGMYKSMDILVM